jgi:hypothetical protein
MVASVSKAKSKAKAKPSQDHDRLIAEVRAERDLAVRRVTLALEVLSDIANAHNEPKERLHLKAYKGMKDVTGVK